MTDYAILISGWSGPGIEWRLSPIRAQLRADGFETRHFGRVGLGWGDIWHIGDDLCQFVCSLKPQHDDSVFLIGHSMGGLVARAANRFSVGLIDGIVTIGTPHYGVEGAEKQIFSASARQMCAGSRFLEDLNHWEPQKHIMSIYGAADFLVDPEKAVWRGSDKIYESGRGHLGMLYDAQVARRVVQYCNAVRSGIMLPLGS